MAHMTDCTCAWCSTSFKARTADVNRGWGRFCSKVCKAKEQEKRTGQNKAYQCGRNSVDGIAVPANSLFTDEMHDAAMDSLSDADYGASDGG